MTAENMSYVKLASVIDAPAVPVHPTPGAHTRLPRGAWRDYGRGLVWDPRAVVLEGRPASMYRIFGKNSRLLYVGCTVDPEARIRESAGMCRWRGKRPLTAIKVEDYATWEQANTAEAIAIETEAPVFNRKPGRRLAEPCPPIRVRWFDGGFNPCEDRSEVEYAAALADYKRAADRLSRFTDAYLEGDQREAS